MSEVQLPSNASDDWVERRLAIDMKEVSRRLLIALIWYAYPMHHLKDISLESPDGERIEFVSEQVTIYGKHVATFCKAKLKEQLDSNPAQFATVLRSANKIENDASPFDEAILLSIQGVYPDHIFTWLTVEASLDPKSDDILFKLNGSFKPGWSPAMTRDILTVMQDYGMERATQVKQDKHWDADHAHFPLASAGLLARYTKPE